MANRDVIDSLAIILENSQKINERFDVLTFFSELEKMSQGLRNNPSDEYVIKLENMNKKLEEEVKELEELHKERTKQLNTNKKMKFKKHRFVGYE